MKRRRLNGGGSVTGGTGDIKPQILTIQGTQGGADDYKVTQVNLPVPRFGMSQPKATIFEILKVMWYPGNQDIADLSNYTAAFLATTDLGRTDGDTSTTGSLTTDQLQTNVISTMSVQRFISTNGGNSVVSPIVDNINDNNGNGVLVATDRMFMVFGTNGATATTTMTCRILYRMVNVGVQEYVGIVQSQLQ